MPDVVVSRRWVSNKYESIDIYGYFERSAVYLSGMCQTAVREQNVYLLCILCICFCFVGLTAAAVSVHIRGKLKERLQLGWRRMSMSILIVFLQPTNVYLPQTVSHYSAFKFTIGLFSEFLLVSSPLQTLFFSAAITGVAVKSSCCSTVAWNEIHVRYQPQLHGEGHIPRWEYVPFPGHAAEMTCGQVSEKDKWKGHWRRHHGKAHLLAISVISAQVCSAVHSVLASDH